MAGITKIISGELSLSKTRGEAFVKELNSKLSPEAILRKKDDQSLPKKK